MAGSTKTSATGRVYSEDQRTRQTTNLKVSGCSTAPVAIGLFAASPAAASSTCSQLANLQRPNTTITTAQDVPAGTFVTPTNPPQSIAGLPAFCRVAGFTTPTSDSHIAFEVWVPEKGWNLKYIQKGCGGFCGSITYDNMAEPLRRWLRRSGDRRWS
jgi:hypothetical protein